MINEEIMYKLFGEKQEKIIDENLNIIKNILSIQDEKVVIDEFDLDIDDYIKKSKDPDYLDDKLLGVNDNGINIVCDTSKIVDLLKKYISRDIKELTIPIAFLNNLDFLSNFNNLKTLNICDSGSLSLDKLDYINNNTSIDNITFKSSFAFNSLRCVDGVNILEADNKIAQYKNITMFAKGYYGKWQDDVKFYTSGYNKDNLNTMEALYDGVSSHLDNISSLSISSNKDDIFNADVELNISNDKKYELYIRGVSCLDASKIYHVINSRIDVGNVKIELENKTYDDIYYLKEMKKKSNLSILYNSRDDIRKIEASYEEFLNMRETIDYYKELLSTMNLSPVEKTLYVYDILKTMRYKENYDDKMRSRDIHAIITDGTVVCAGYSSFAKQLLEEIGIKSINVGVVCMSDQVSDVGHARNFVRVDDEKYNIHGLYAMDITWDSDKDISVREEDNIRTVVARPSEEDQDKIVDKYDNLVLYRYFLVPMSDYELRFPDEKNPRIFDMYKDGQLKETVQEIKKVEIGEMSSWEFKDSLLLDQYRKLFSSNEGFLTIKDYFMASKPTLEQFEKMLFNVRCAEGYQEQAAKDDVKRVEELHEMLKEQNPDAPDLFFKSNNLK